MGQTVNAASKRPAHYIVLDVIACIACIFSLASCALTSKGSSPATNPSISVTPSLVSFGNVKIKTQTSQTLRLSNPGAKDLVISQATISGEGFSVSGLTAPMTVAAGTSMNFTVLFQPTTTGTASASISISSNATTTPLTVSLTGTGVIESTPAISVTPTAISFGNLTVKTSATQTVKLSNTGTADLAISQATLSGTGFSMAGLTAPVTVAAGASTTFTVSFQPTATGAAAGSVTITSNASPSPLTVSLTGTGVAASTPAISVTPSAVSFGNQTVKTSASQTVTVFEHGDGGAIDLAGECKWNRLQHDGAGSAGDGSGWCKHKLYSYVSAGDGGSRCRECNDHEQREPFTADGKPDRHRCGGIDSSNQCDAGCSELREPDGKDIGEPNGDGFEHGDGGTIDFAGECEWNRLQHDGAGSAGDGSGRCKRKLYSYVSAGDDGSGCRERLDHEQCEPLTADGKPDGHRGGGIDSSHQRDAGRGELREPDGEDIDEPDCDGIEHGTAALSISQASVSGTGYSMTGLTCASDGSGRRKHKLYSFFQPATTGAAAGSISITSNASPHR